MNGFALPTVKYCYVNGKLISKAGAGEITRKWPRESVQAVITRKVVGIIVFNEE